MFRALKNKMHGVRLGHYMIVLYAFILLFAFRPHYQSLTFIAIWQFLLIATFLVSAFRTPKKIQNKFIFFFFAILSLILGWIELFYQSEPIFVTSSISIVIFMCMCSIKIVNDVILRAKVTLETLRGVICAYFMIAFAFAYTYYLIEYIYPNSFHLIPHISHLTTHDPWLSELMYFSFVTLLTIGYGDITPLLDLSQTVVIIEGIIGQFYVAILVARIVSVYSFTSLKRTKAIPSD